MKLAGVLQLGNYSSFVFINYQNKTDIFINFRTMTIDDEIRESQGLTRIYPKLCTPAELFDVDSEKYFVGAIKKSKATGAVSKSGVTNDIQQLLDLIRFAQTYKFASSSITRDVKEMRLAEEYREFRAKDDTLEFSYETYNDEIYTATIKYGANELRLAPVSKIPSISYVKFTEAVEQEQAQISKALLKDIHYDDLARVLDMSWYKDADGKVLKDYRPVHSIDEFEDMFTELMEYACTVDEVIIGLDTETTGVNIYNLSDSNTAKDHCVEISVSWLDNQAYCIFTDMEYLTSVSAEYCFKRFAEIFTEERDQITITWNHGKRTETFPRERFHLVGQNFPFDRRVSFTTGHPIWFDDDTLSMGFTIDPRAVRGNVKLKNMTRRIFHHETPELSDVLGNGNEDKYRLLADEEVACIYAGADSDYTRLLYFKLRELLGEKMYAQYHKQDVRMLNILSESEFNGLRVKPQETIDLAKQVEADLCVLREAAYSYVGAYMDYNQKMISLQSQLDLNLISQAEFIEQAKNIHPDKDARYEFEFKGADFRYIMYDILHYPIMATTDTGLPKVDKGVRKKLLAVERKQGSTARKLQTSILVANADYAEYSRLCNGSKADKERAKEMELISADEFNSKEYPLVLIFEKYAILNKEYTSYFKPIIENNLEGKLFKSYSLARIETRRIMNPLQTIKKNLKELVIPSYDDYYTMDFDLSQIEVRLMYSLSHSEELIQKMRNPESDVHTESAAMANHIPAYKVTKYQRKGAKSVSFGMPYGLGLRSLCEKIFGDTSKEHLVATAVIIHNWKQVNGKIVDFLEKARDDALIPVEISKAKRDFMDAYQRDPETGEYIRDEHNELVPIPLGAVYNELGFCRYFDLTNVDQSDEAKRRRASGKYTGTEGEIRRAAGNFPIQAYAAEFFRKILYRFYDSCKRYGIADKVKWNMLIHDELLASVHKSVNPILMVKIVKEACMITMPGHTNYFVGINFGDTWEEAKDDSRELPVILVKRLIERWDAGEFREQTWFDHPWDFIEPLRKQYVQDRIYEVVKSILPNVDVAPINLSVLLEKFDNYTVRAYVEDYSMNGDIPADTPKDFVGDAKWIKKFETWVIKVFGEGKEMISTEGVKYKVYTTGKLMIDDLDDRLFTFDDSDFDDVRREMDEAMYDYDFDEGNVVDTYFSESDDTADEELTDNDGFDISNIFEISSFKTKYTNIKVLNSNVVISVDDVVQIAYLKTTLKPGAGNLVIFKLPNGSVSVWKRISSDTDLGELDLLVSRVRQKPKSATIMGDRIFFNINNNSEERRLQKFVQQNTGYGYKVFSKSNLGEVKLLGQITPLADYSSLT